MNEEIKNGYQNSHRIVIIILEKNLYFIYALCALMPHDLMAQTLVKLFFTGQTFVSKSMIVIRKKYYSYKQQFVSDNASNTALTKKVNPE